MSYPWDKWLMLQNLLCFSHLMRIGIFVLCNQTCWTCPWLIVLGNTWVFHPLFPGIDEKILKQSNNRFGRHYKDEMRISFQWVAKKFLLKAQFKPYPHMSMSCFHLSQTLCDDIHRMMARFWWGSTSVKKKIHWKKQVDLYLPKEVGGFQRSGKLQQGTIS